MQSIPLFKLHLPYDETDHVLNIAMNLLAGGNVPRTSRRPTLR